MEDSCWRVLNKYIGSLGSAAIMVESKGGWDGVGICTCLNIFSQLPSCSICVVNNVVEEEPGCNMQGNSNEKLMSSILGLLEVRRRWNSQAVEAMCYWDRVGREEGLRKKSCLISLY